MRSKDLKNIKEAPGDPNAGLVRDPKTGRFIQGNQGGVQFAPNRKRNKAGDLRGMTGGSRNQQYRKKGDPEFDRIAQQNRQFRPEKT